MELFGSIFQRSIVSLLGLLLAFSHSYAFSNDNQGASVATWSNLRTEQKAALAPLAHDWDRMDGTEKRKWLAVAAKYEQMKPEEKMRVQERIHAWVKLSPSQRKLARENFNFTSKKTPEQKSAQWQQYQQLSEEEKARLASQAKVKSPVTAVQPTSKQDTKNVLPPLKKGPVPTPSTKPIPASKPVEQQP